MRLLGYSHAFTGIYSHTLYCMTQYSPIDILDLLDFFYPLDNRYNDHCTRAIDFGAIRSPAMSGPGRSL